MKKRKTRSFEVWVVLCRDEVEWVFTGEGAKKEALESLNRPAGQRARQATLIVTE